MELPRGITGFRDSGDPPLPMSDIRRFRGVCHTAARALGGRIGPEDGTRSATANYLRIVVEFADGSVAVLLNHHHPIVAISAWPFAAGTDRVSIETTSLAGLLQTSGGYLVLSPEVATMPLTAELCRRLAPAEMSQIKYWRPRSIGAVIFNDWD